MTKTKILKRTGLVLLAGLTCLTAYEIYRLNWAKSVAQARFSNVLESSEILSSDLTPEQRRILLTVQDPNFETHKGIDLSTPGAGLTTITQSLTKRVFFEDFKPGFAKIEQTLIARFVVNGQLSKNDQLTVFMNTAYFGRCKDRQITGYAAAADCYLSKGFDDLTEQDFVNLTARLIAPNKYNRDAGALTARIEKINNLLAGTCRPTGLRDQTYEDC